MGNDQMIHRIFQHLQAGADKRREHSGPRRWGGGSGAVGGRSLRFDVAYGVLHVNREFVDYTPAPVHLHAEVRPERCAQLFQLR